MGLEMRVIFVVVAVVVVCLLSDTYADEGTATFYTPPYVRKYMNFSI